MSREAVAAVGRHLDQYGAAPLTADQLGRYRGLYAHGWRLGIVLDDGSAWELDILLPAGFPFTPPRLAVANSPPLLTWPHLEELGLLCVYDDSTLISPTRHEAVIDSLLHDGIALLEDCVAGRNVEDFRDEFMSYWSRGTTVGGPGLVSLLSPDGGHREIFVWRNRAYHVVADTAADLVRWLANSGVRPNNRGSYTLARGLLLWPAVVPLPADYPATGSDLRRLFEGDDTALALLADLAARDAVRTDVVLGMKTKRGIGFGAVRPGVPRGRTDMVQKGFRPGRVPSRLALQRALSPAARTDRIEVTRADHGWVHGRDQDDRQADLRSKHVAYVGCGSLGSMVVAQLAAAGVGRHTVIDGERLKFENVVRHLLGAAQADENKAIGTVERLRRDYPHQRFDAIPRHLQAGDKEIMKVLGEVDLVVTTTGLWPVDMLLNQLHLERRIKGVLFGWLEPEAAAAHSVTVDGKAGCLHCGFTADGAPLLPVTTWQDAGLRDIPACGGAFSAYGPNELAAGVTLAAEAAVAALLGETRDNHQVWVGDTRRLVGTAGRISGAWLKAEGDPGGGRFVRDRHWPHAADCPACASKAAAA